MSSVKVSQRAGASHDAGLRFMEEFVWFLQTQKQPIASELDAIVRGLRKTQNVRSLAERAGSDVDLIGVLPYLLVDTEIFATNEDIVLFFQEVFGTGIPRWQKKSRMEIIGLVVTTVAISDKKPGKSVLKALELLSADGAAREAVSKMRNNGELSWTRLIEGLNTAA
jgi:hypothetical protein